jgi:hypothetical protein
MPFSRFGQAMYPHRYRKFVAYYSGTPQVLQ